MRSDSRDQLEREFEVLRPLYKNLAEDVAGHIKFDLKALGLEDFEVSSRVKTTTSFIKKFRNPDKKYSDPFVDIMDIAGVRVLHSYLGDYSVIDEYIRQNYIVDTENSVNKSDILNPDQFGYLSVHYVVQLPRSLVERLGNIAYFGRKLEVQVRTNLQHVWANVSHKLNYKAQSDVPYQLQRKLNRLAGLFELADQEFNEIKCLSDEIVSGYGEKIRRDPVSVDLNVNSLRSILQQEQFIKDGMALIESTSKGKELVEVSVSDLREECARVSIENAEGLIRLIRGFNRAPEVARAISELPTITINHSAYAIVILAGSVPHMYRGLFIRNRFGWPDDLIQLVHGL